MLHILVSFNESLPPAPVYYSVHVVRGVSGQGGLYPRGVLYLGGGSLSGGSLSRGVSV